MICNLFPKSCVRYEEYSFYGPRQSDNGADTDLMYFFLLVSYILYMYCQYTRFGNLVFYFWSAGSYDMQCVQCMSNTELRCMASAYTDTIDIEVSRLAIGSQKV